MYMTSKRFSINDLRTIITDIAVMRDDELVDKAATTLLALVDYQGHERES